MGGAPGPKAPVGARCCTDLVTVKEQVNRRVRLWPVLESGTMNFTMTKTFLSVWPFGTRIRSGTGTTMRVGSQLVGTPSTPLKVTVPCFVPKLFPLIVMSVFTGPQAGERLQKPACLLPAANASSRILSY